MEKSKSHLLFSGLPLGETETLKRCLKIKKEGRYQLPGFLWGFFPVFLLNSVLLLNKLKASSYNQELIQIH